MKIIGAILVNTVALLITEILVPGVVIADYKAALVAAVVIGLINTFIKPIVKFVTLPITFLTLGLFSLVLNIIFLLLAAHLTPGFDINGFIPAILGSIVLSIISSFLGMLTK